MSRRKYLEIAESLELQIISGQLKPGDRLPPERQLMQQFDAGRSSVREALFHLQRQGLIDSTPGAVSRVSRPTADKIFAELSGAVRHLLTQPEGLRQLQDARVLFEAGLARRAALLRSDAELADLVDVHDRMTSVTDLEEFAVIDMDFHLHIARMARNPIFEGLNGAMSAWLKEQRLRSAAAGATIEGVVRQHQKILDAIAAQDEQAAMIAMEDHLESVSRHYWQAVVG